MSVEEIEKLRTRVDKDPNSRLFLPLAEEYRKAGMPDEAIGVILRGLEHQPGYTSARVALGRIYLEKSMIEEAVREFETVVNTIPDNLFAHKKLADIYKERGETGKAISEYKTVLQLNPQDDDAIASLSEIEGGEPDQEAMAVAPAASASAPKPEISGISAEEELAEEEEIAEVAEAEAAEAEVPGGIPDDFESFRSSFGGGDAKEEVDEEAEEAIEISDDESAEVADMAVDEASFGDIMSDTSAVAEEIAEVPEYVIPEEAVAIPEKAPDVSEADAFIAAGNFYKALETYRRILDDDPENKQVLQRVAELKTLMTLMGKGNEVLIDKLQSFLDAVKRGSPKRP